MWVSVPTSESVLSPSYVCPVRFQVVSPKQPAPSPGLTPVGLIGTPPTLSLQDQDGWFVNLSVKGSDGFGAGFDWQRRELVDLSVALTIPGRDETVRLEIVYEDERAQVIGVHVQAPGRISARKLRRIPYGRCIATALAAASWVSTHGLSTEPSAVAATSAIPRPDYPADI